MRRQLTTAMLGFAILALGACGGSSPTTPNPPTPQPPATPRVSFTADSSNTGVDAIALSMSTSTQSTFTLVLTAQAVTDLFGYGVDITFDPAVVMFDSFQAGSFFDETGVTVTTQVTENPSGTLVIGQSRVGSVQGVSGNGTLLTLNFKAVTAGTSTFVTANGAAFDSTGAALETQFFGGTATVPAQSPQPSR